MDNQSAIQGLEDLQEVAGYLGLEDGDEFHDMGYDDFARRWSLEKVKRALHVCTHKDCSSCFPREIDTKGATRYEFQLIAPFLYWYQETLRNEAAAADDVSTNDDDVPANDDDDDAKFLRQVWKDKGYGVDCIPESIDSPFTPMASPNESQSMKEHMQFVMSALNDDSGEKYKKTYTLLEIEDAVWTRTASYYFTFKAKQDGEEQVVEKFRAMVSVFPPPICLLEYKRLLADGSWELNVVTPYGVC